MKTIYVTIFQYAILNSLQFDIYNTVILKKVVPKSYQRIDLFIIVWFKVAKRIARLIIIHAVQFMQ